MQYQTLKSHSRTKKSSSADFSANMDFRRKNLLNSLYAITPISLSLGIFFTFSYSLRWNLSNAAKGLSYLLRRMQLVLSLTVSLKTRCVRYWIKCIFSSTLYSSVHPVVIQTMGQLALALECTYEMITVIASYFWHNTVTDKYILNMKRLIFHICQCILRSAYPDKSSTLWEYSTFLRSSTRPNVVGLACTWILSKTSEKSHCSQLLSKPFKSIFQGKKQQKMALPKKFP